MKKLFLLLASGSIVFAADAQQMTHSVMRIPSAPPMDLSNYANVIRERVKGHATVSGTANKTTAAPRWYSYVDYFNQNETASSSSIDFAAPYLWGRADALMAYGDGSGGTTWDTSNFISYGTIIDPAFGTAYNGFNNFTYYGGETKITSTDAFKIDSIAFSGFYQTNPGKFGASGFVDTIRVALTYGTGATSTPVKEGSLTVATGDVFVNFGAAVGSTFKYQYMFYDVASRKVTGTPNFTYDILLDNTTTPPSWAADTNSVGNYIGNVQIPGGGFNIPAGNMVGITVSFLSGDATFTPNDTVFLGSAGVNPVKYNMFRPFIAYKGAGAVVNWPAYDVLDRNTGSYAAREYDPAYTPHWFWSAGSGAATAQYPDISFRVSECTTCGVVTEDPGVGVNTVANILKSGAYPNPASGEVNVPFVLGTKANVTVSLTNVLGQVVATKDMGNVSLGTAVFNTNVLANGLYTYTVTANGERTTGRIAVAH